MSNGRPSPSAAPPLRPPRPATLGADRPRPSGFSGPPRRGPFSHALATPDLFTQPAASGYKQHRAGLPHLHRPGCAASGELREQGQYSNGVRLIGGRRTHSMASNRHVLKVCCTDAATDSSPRPCNLPLRGPGRRVPQFGHTRPALSATGTTTRLLFSWAHSAGSIVGRNGAGCGRAGVGSRCVYPPDGARRRPGPSRMPNLYEHTFACVPSRSRSP